MTNREIIKFAIDNGFEDVTEDEYDVYEYAPGRRMKQKKQNDYLTFSRSFGDGVLTITVSNDRWSSDGISETDRVSSNDYVWFNKYMDNEDVYAEHYIEDMRLVSGKGIAMHVNEWSRKSRSFVKRRKMIEPGYVQEDIE